MKGGANAVFALSLPKNGLIFVIAKTMVLRNASAKGRFSIDDIEPSFFN